MESGSNEKLVVTNKDALRRRHAGNYQAVANGEIYLLPYEVELRSKNQSFFDGLSDFDFLKHPPATSNLSLKTLNEELRSFDDNLEGKGFWKNFNDSALKSHLNVILGIVVESKGDADWRKTYLKQAGEKDEDKPHHNDMLRCIYLLAHLHKASPSYIRELSASGCAWSAELRVYYPRTDFAFSAEYGAYLSELYVNILYHQPEGIRKLVKYLDKLIEKLVQFSDSVFVNPMLDDRSEDTDSPGLKILKHNQIASITHFQALNRLLIENISGSFTDLSFAELEGNKSEGLATAQHYKLVAAQCVRMEIGVPSYRRDDGWYTESGELIQQAKIDTTMEVYLNALAADALRGIKFESDGSKGGKKDTSIQSAIRKMADQNPQTIEEILAAKSIDCADIPEVYSKYLIFRTRYAAAFKLGQEQGVVDELRPNQKVERVLAYIRGNSLEKIHVDIEKLESKLACMKYLSRLLQPSNTIDNPTMVYEYGLHELPDRQKSLIYR